jgi:phosphomannomutase/phosphoglucomutase
MKIPPHIFRAYDIRGIYGEDLTEETSKRIGQAFASCMDGAGKNFVVGRDVRLSGEVLEKALIEGMLSIGCNVQEIGMLPTPLFYFAIVHYGKDGGAMVTASHNPAEWNGFKLCREKGLLCAQGMGMEKIKEAAVTGELRAGARGKIEHYDGVVADYSKFALSKVEIARQLKVALDPGNGTCALLVPELFQDAGLEVVAINAEPDGSFPSRSPEPTEKSLGELKKVVLAKGADFGVGYDGDGDRALFVDNRGRVLSGDITLTILARYHLHKRRGAKILYDVACSSSVAEVIKAHGGKPILSRIGHAYIMDRMIKENIELGGEISSHIYFSEVYGFDDGLFATLKLAELLSKTDRKLDELVDSIPRYPATPVKVYDCPDERKFKVVEELTKEFKYMGYETVTLDGVKIIEPKGWVLIRASNTLPQIKMIAEAKTQEELRQLTDFAERKILEKTRRK